MNNMNSSSASSLKALFHRLKYELLQHYQLVIILWVILGGAFWQIYRWSSYSLLEHNVFISGPLEHFFEGFDVYYLIALGLSSIVTAAITIRLFKQDELRSPQAFWATRPIRAMSYFGAKIWFVGLFVVLPYGLLGGGAYLMFASGLTFLWAMIECMAMVSVLIVVVMLACMTFEGMLKPVLCVAGYCVVFLAAMVFNLDFVRDVATYGGVPYRNCLNAEGMAFSQSALRYLPIICGLGLVGWFQLKAYRRRGNRLVVVSFGALAAILMAFSDLLISCVLVETGVGRRELPKMSGKIGYEQLTNVYELIAASSDGRQTVGFAMTCSQPLPSGSGELNFGSFFKADLKVEGYDDIPLHAKLAHPFDPDGKPIKGLLKVWVDFKVSDSSSHIGDHMILRKEHKEQLKSLPRRVVRITGMVPVYTRETRELYRGPIAKPFIKQEGQVQFGFVYPMGADMPAFGYQRFAMKRIAPMDLRFSESLANPVETLYAHAEDEYGSYDLLNSNMYEKGMNLTRGSIGSFVFSTSGLSAYLDEVETALKAQNRSSWLDDWAKQADVVFTAQSPREQALLPIDLEVEIPDPVLVQKMFENGEL